MEQERSRFSAFGGGCHQKIGISVVKHPRLGTIEFFNGQPDGQPAERRNNFDATAANPGGALYVSRADALPELWQVGREQLVWAAGVHTWHKLAQRGVWVNGSCDGLGESIPELTALLGETVSWTKLTHDQSGNDKTFPCLATYHLEPLGSVAPPPILHSYFWTSESLFRWAISLRPEIRQARHATGPGYTAEAIEKELGRGVDVYYNYAHWRTGNATDEP